ncbi:hypothetical protein PUN28_010400 [Cardiocondyla obscurior]|uniref:Uncharacterized protein n=1 Tax=Cardiocondyla obscurior TaxID=286306 RepID=A0AAW2FS19_9HYME
MDIPRTNHILISLQLPKSVCISSKKKKSILFYILIMPIKQFVQSISSLNLKTTQNLIDSNYYQHTFFYFLNEKTSCIPYLDNLLLFLLFCFFTRGRRLFRRHSVKSNAVSG